MEQERTQLTPEERAELARLEAIIDDALNDLKARGWSEAEISEWLTQEGVFDE